MAEPMMKEDAAPARRKTDIPSGMTPESFAYAKALERKLGRRLRMEIEWPLTEAEEEEVVLARLMYDESIPAEKFLEEFKHLRAEKPQ